MANIKLNNNEYSIPDSVLATHTADLIAHLGTIAGNGLKVVVGGVEYFVDSSKVAGAIAEIEGVLEKLENGDEERLEGDGAEYYTLAPTALSFRSTAPLNELQEVQINGVTVDPSNYTLEEGSTIVTFPIDYLKTLNVGDYEVNIASESKSVKGNFTVAAPELNEHGFYYNQPYTAYIGDRGDGVIVGTTCVLLHEDNTLDMCFIMHNVTETCSYTCNDNILAFTSETFGYVEASITANGEIDASGLLFVLNENIIADKEYLYFYNEYDGGYAVRPIDKTKASYAPIRTGINGIDTISIAQLAFSFSGIDVGGNTNMIVAPKIPNTVRIIGQGAFSNCTNLRSINLPNGLTTIKGSAFNGCTALTTIMLPNSVTDIDHNAFNCTSLTNINIPNGVTHIGMQAFAKCEKLTNIVFDGTVAQWNAISRAEGWNSAVPATYVQCSDGQVAL